MYWEMEVTPARDGLNKLIFNQFNVHVDFTRMTESQINDLQSVLKAFSKRYE